MHDMTVSRYTLTVNRKYNCVGERETFNISYITFGKSADFAQNQYIGARTDSSETQRINNNGSMKALEDEIQFNNAE